MTRTNLVPSSDLNPLAVLALVVKPAVNATRQPEHQFYLKETQLLRSAAFSLRSREMVAAGRGMSQRLVSSLVKTIQNI